MSMDQRAQILEALTSATFGVREIVQALNWKTSRVVSLLEKMEDERLIILQQTAPLNRGRPKKTMTCTSLGIEFLETYRRLKTKPLKARKTDLERAVKDARYADRLLANGHSPFKLFMELNAIANNISLSSEALQTT